MAATCAVVAVALHAGVHGRPDGPPVFSTSSTRLAMTLAVFSDVHANLPALEAVLADIDTRLGRMAEAHADVLLFGHTHRPYHKALRAEVDGQTVYRHAVNTGSVGKPKDGDPRAGYVLLTVDAERPQTDPDYCRTEFVRVPYDVEEAARAVEASPLPDAFAEGLRRAV